MVEKRVPCFVSRDQALVGVLTPRRRHLSRIPSSRNPHAAISKAAAGGQICVGYSLRLHLSTMAHGQCVIYCALPPSSCDVDGFDIRMREVGTLKKQRLGLI